MEFITQLFNQLDHVDSITVLAFLLGAFLIGLLTGRGFLSGKLKKTKAALKSKESELSTLSIEHGALRQSYEQREVEIKKLEATVNSYKASFAAYDEEKNNLNKDLYFAREENQKLSDQAEQYINQIALLEGELDMIKTTPVPSEEIDENLDIEIEQGPPSESLDLETDIRLRNIESKLLLLETENIELKNQIAQGPQVIKNNTRSETELRYINLKLERLVAENDTLKKQIKDLLNADEDLNIPTPLQSDNAPVFEVIEEDEIEEIDLDQNIFEQEEIDSDEDKAQNARQKLETLIGKKIPKATEAVKDDLKAINGIGPFIEKKLNTVGIFTFDQISEFDDDLIQLITDAIQFFPGRIKRDEWVQQADDLKNKKE